MFVMFSDQLVLYQFIFRHPLKPFWGHSLTLRFFIYLEIFEHKLKTLFRYFGGWTQAGNGFPSSASKSNLLTAGMQIATGFFIFIQITRTLESYHCKRNSIITNKAVSWNVEVCREIEQLSDILHFSLEMTNHPISFQRGAILPNLDPQNNFPISKCYI